jgi:hypothetical protein
MGVRPDTCGFELPAVLIMTMLEAWSDNALEDVKDVTFVWLFHAISVRMLPLGHKLIRKLSKLESIAALALRLVGIQAPEPSRRCI